MAHPAPVMDIFASIPSVRDHLYRSNYVADDALATVVYLAFHMQKPVFLEGEPGVGKTELAIALAEILQTRLIRLQCHEGLDTASALYEWNYPKQLLRIKMEQQSGKTPEQIGATIYTEPYLLQRPLLAAIRSAQDQMPILLIDELDQADEEFEAFLLELLSDFQITIPELGTLKAIHIPLVIITSNRTRDVHDAIKRRCLYHWIDYPDFEKEMKIIRTRIPEIDTSLARQVVQFMEKIRKGDFRKPPGISETLDWATALIHLHRSVIDPETVEQTMGCILKYREDMAKLKSNCCQYLNP